MLVGRARLAIALASVDVCLRLSDILMLASLSRPNLPKPPASTSAAGLTHHVNVGDLPLEEEEEHGMDQS